MLSHKNIIKVVKVCNYIKSLLTKLNNKLSAKFDSLTQKKITKYNKAIEGLDNLKTRTIKNKEEDMYAMGVLSLELTKLTEGNK